MKKFSEISTIQESVSDIQQPKLVSDIQQPVADTQSNNTFPSYMVNDSEFVGYDDENLQMSVYRAAEFGTIVTGFETVLDVGCGRADFGDFLLKRHPQLNYTGIDLNTIMIQLGNLKYSEKYQNSQFKLDTVPFHSQFQTNQTFDYVYHIANMSSDYGVYDSLHQNDNRYHFIKSIIEKSLEICNIGVVMMLLNDKEQNEGYVTYSLEQLSKILYDSNYRFAIDNTDIHNMYKLVILKNKFIFV